MTPRRYDCRARRRGSRWVEAAGREGCALMVTSLSPAECPVCPVTANVSACSNFQQPLEGTRERTRTSGRANSSVPSADVTDDPAALRLPRPPPMVAVCGGSGTRGVRAHGDFLVASGMSGVSGHSECKRLQQLSATPGGDARANAHVRPRELVGSLSRRDG